MPILNTEEENNNKFSSNAKTINFFGKTINVYAFQGKLAGMQWEPKLSACITLT